MAMSAGDSSVLEEELTCPVCLDLYRDPHLLPCGHNFCLPCLRKLKSRADRGRLRCPECRQTHRSSASWQKNFKLANIADGFRRRGQSERSAQSDASRRSTQVCCDYCPEEASEYGKGPVAVKTCLKCEVSMCPKHVQPHLELPAFREHPLVEPLGDMRKRKCLEHDEMFRYYCLDECLFLCNACTIEGTHCGHSIKTLKNTMKDFKSCLDIELQKTNRKILKAEKNRLEQKEIERHNKVYITQHQKDQALPYTVCSTTSCPGPCHFYTGLLRCSSSGTSIKHNQTSTEDSECSGTTCLLQTQKSPCYISLCLHALATSCSSHQVQDTDACI